MNSILITGATGFVGRSLTQSNLFDGWRISGTILAFEPLSALAPGVEPIVVEPLGPATHWERALKNVDIVVHLAARVHVMQDTSVDPLKEFRWTNTEGTIRLARQAAAAGVKRFVFMSTIGVNGNLSGTRAFTEDDKPAPHNPYSISKWEAEISLRDISVKSGMEVVVVRAPLVYGPGNPGNFLTFLGIIAKGIPLPLASIHNQKSFLYVENLANALACCATNSNAAGQTYLVSDLEDVSIPELIRRVASALGRPARLVPFPPGLLRLAGQLFNKSAAVNSVLGSLSVDCRKIQRELNWKPPYSMGQGLQKTAEWFKCQLKR